jgi:hypothetical protein
VSGAACTRVTLDLAPDDDTVAAVAAQIPEATSLEPGARVMVLAARAPRGGLLAKLRTPPPVALATRATALLVRGYVDLAMDGDAVSGRAPPDGGAAADVS